MKSDLENDQLYDVLFSAKDNLRLDLDIQNFANQCFFVKHGLFLRIYELKDKLRFDSEKKTVMRDRTSCVVEKFNNFNVTRIEFNKSIRQTFGLIDIIYKPVRKPDEIMNSYFSEKLNLAFCASFSEGTKAKHC